MVVEMNGGGWATTARHFSFHVITSRWFMVFASVLVMSMAGASYMFGLYSNDIKSSLGYDQKTVNWLSFFKDIGGNSGIVSGLINGIFPTWIVLCIAASMNFFGYFMIWLAVTKKIAKPELWQMCLYICLGANSQALVNTGASVACVKNFPENRGVVLGFLKGFVGLSGAIITQIYYGFFGKNSEALILLIGWLPAAVSLIFICTIRVVKGARRVNELKVFYDLLYVSLGLAGFLMIVIVLQNRLMFSKFEYVTCATVVMIFLFAPLAIVIREEVNVWRNNNNNNNNDNNYVDENPPTIELGQHDTSSEVSKPVPWWKNVFNPPERGEDYTILQAICSLDMIILFTATTFGAGGTLTAINNLGQIGKSLNYPTKSISTFISLVSIWNYLGRVTSGYTSEVLLLKYKVPRTMMLTLVLLLSCSGHLMIAFGLPYSLYASSIIIGFCFGAQWPLIFAIISEIFGLKYYSILYNIGAGASPVGNYILNVRVAGGFYDKEALKQMGVKGVTRKAGEDLKCIGVECYKHAFWVITAATMVGAFFSFILVIRTAKFYRGDIYKKLREQAVRHG